MQHIMHSIPARIMKVTSIRPTKGGYVVGWEAFCYNCHKAFTYGPDQWDLAVQFTHDHKCYSKKKVQLVQTPNPNHHNEKLRSGSYGQNAR